MPATCNIFHFRHHTYVLSNGTIVRRPQATQHQQKSPHDEHSMLPNLFASNLTNFKPNRIQKRKPIDDLLSKNISFLLENLLKRYESSHLPTHGQGMLDMFTIYLYSVKLSKIILLKGIPTVVKTNMLIRSMGPISELDMVSDNI